MAKIIATYPACGKSYYAQHHTNAIDLEYSHYAWIEDENGNKVKNLYGDKIPNYAFPRNYIEAICKAHEKIDWNKHDYVDYIFVNAHDKILKELIQLKIPVTVIIPHIELRNQWKKRLEQRGDDIFFINQQMNNWYTWLTEIKANKENFEKLIELNENEYVSNIIERL